MLIPIPKSTVLYNVGSWDSLTCHVVEQKRERLDPRLHLSRARANKNACFATKVEWSGCSLYSLSCLALRRAMLGMRCEWVVYSNNVTSSLFLESEGEGERGREGERVAIKANNSYARRRPHQMLACAPRHRRMCVVQGWTKRWSPGSVNMR